MTEPKGAFPPNPRNGSGHFLRCSGGHVPCVWSGSHWLVPLCSGGRTSEQMVAEGWSYLGPAPTHKEAQDDAADVRRFRWLLENASAHYRTGDDWYSSMIQWNAQTRCEDIRAAIDAAMKEDGDATPA